MADLSNVKVAVIATNGVEESELVQPIDALRESGAQVRILSPEGGALQCMQHDEKSRVIESDATVAESDPDDYDALLLPGGAFNADVLRMEEEVRWFAKRTNDAGKPMAVICHAPWVLVSAGLVDGRTLTSYHTLQDDIKNAGGNWVDQEVVLDGNWVTSRKPDDIPVFLREFTQLLSRVPAQAGGERQ